MSEGKQMARLLKNVFTELRYRGIIKNQTAFGERLKYNRSYVSELLNGATPITAKLITAIAEEFGVSPAYFTSNGEQQMFDSEPIKSTPEITPTEDRATKNTTSVGTMIAAAMALRKAGIIGDNVDHDRLAEGLELLFNHIGANK